MELSLVPVCNRLRSGDSYFCDLLGLTGVIILHLVPHGIVGRPVRCPSPRSPSSLGPPLSFCSVIPQTISLGTWPLSLTCPEHAGLSPSDINVSSVPFPSTLGGIFCSAGEWGAPCFAHVFLQMFVAKP